MQLINDDCLNALNEIKSNSLDSLVTDPPAGISFMSMDWDKNLGGRDNWIDCFQNIFKECCRVMKPGAHGVVWAIPRTSHWTATALENAGFEIRDIVTHLFGSGFPKSHNISKGIDKKFGVEREVIGVNINGCQNNYKCSSKDSKNIEVTKSTTPQAKQWDGYGTALKPAAEFWILIRKPLSEKTIVNNVLKHGVGGINIDGTRINNGIPLTKGGCTKVGGMFGSGNVVTKKEGHEQGRFPANFILSHNDDCKDKCTEGCAVDLLDKQSGVLRKCSTIGKVSNENNFSFKVGEQPDMKKLSGFKANDYAGASRFFYVAKASKSERNKGLEGMEKKPGGTLAQDKWSQEKFGNAGTGRLRENHHPTVKPLKLMQYLCRLVTPKNGIVLDPFMGSGSTGIAALSEGFDFIGIEKEKEYFDIAEKRIND